MSSLDDKVVLITGGARGIGAATAKRLVSKGARVVLVDLDAQALADTADEIGKNVATAVGDVCELESMERAVQSAIDAFGQIDVVLANAGIASYGSVLNVDPQAFRRVIDVNLMGIFNTVRPALPHVIERKGYILVVGSLASYAGAPGLASYNASKAGAEHFANSLRLEVAHLGVKVGSAHMSWIDTPLVQEAKADLSAFRQMLDTLPGPLSNTTSVAACAKGFVRGIENRSTRVNVPGWVGGARWLKPLITSKIGERTALKDAARLMPLMDEEVAALGRSTSARTLGLGGAQSPGVTEGQAPAQLPAGD